MTTDDRFVSGVSSGQTDLNALIERPIVVLTVADHDQNGFVNLARWPFASEAHTTISRGHILENSPSLTSETTMANNTELLACIDKIRSREKTRQSGDQPDIELFREALRHLCKFSDRLAATPKAGVNATDDSLAKTVTTAVLSALKAGGDNLTIFNAVKQALPSVSGGVDQPSSADCQQCNEQSGQSLSRASDAHGDGYCGCTERCKDRDNCQYDVKPQELNDQDEVLLAYGLLWCVNTTDQRVHSARRELLKCLNKDLQAKAISAARTTLALVRDIRQMKGATFAADFDAQLSTNTSSSRLPSLHREPLLNPATQPPESGAR